MILYDTTTCNNMLHKFCHIFCFYVCRSLVYSSSPQSSAHIDNSGQIDLWYKARMTLLCHGDPLYIPFDNLRCHVSFGSLSMDASKQRLLLNPKHLLINEKYVRLATSEWCVVASKVNETVDKTDLAILSRAWVS